MCKQEGITVRPRGAASESKERDENSLNWQWAEDQGPHKPAGAGAVGCELNS